MLGVVGVNHRTAAIAARERFHVAEEEVADVTGTLVAAPTLEECVVLSTCNRTEVYYAASEAGAAEEHLLEALARRSGLSPREVRDMVAGHRGIETVIHLFRVASGLDSLVMGEPQIQGQVGRAYQAGRHVERGVGPLLHRLFQSALSAGGRVRSETSVAEGAASVPSAAVELARKVLGSLAGHRAMVVGTGDMGKLTLDCLADAGAVDMLVASRSVARAEATADRVGGRAIPHDAFWDHLGGVELLVTSTTAARPFITAERIGAARTGRDPLVILDIALPRNVEEAAGELEGVFLYNLDDLQRVVEGAEAARAEAAPVAEAIVREEAERYWQWYRERRAAPVIRRMRTQAEAIRRREMERALEGLDSLDEEARRRIHMASRAALNKILHGPTVALRELARQRDGERHLDRLASLLTDAEADDRGAEAARGEEGDGEGDGEADG